MIANIKKLSLVATTAIVLAGCVTTNNGQNNMENTNNNNNSIIAEGKMDSSKIKAPQVGLSDQEWNQSRPTTSDGRDTNSENAPTRILTKDAKSIIIYFSRSGSTELLASKVQSLSNADVVELVVEDTYSSDYYQTVTRANGEREQVGNPKLNVEIPDLSQYDNVYLGYPIWGMTLAEPMASFVEEYGDKLAGKNILPFSTNGSYGIGSSVTRIQNILNEKGVRDVKIKDAYTVEGNKVDKADESLKAWFDRVNS